MNIEISLLKEVIEEMLNSIQKKVKGDMQPELTRYEALRELGVIFELVISLQERLDDRALISELWFIRDTITITTQKLLGN